MNIRLIAGRLGGRKIACPPSGRTHPMGERIRGSLFNILGDITGKTVLDAFAGSGSLGFEAISRGASSATLLERDTTAQRVIVENITTLGLQDVVKIIKTSVSQWDESAPTTQFDIIFADPPYHDLQLSTVQRLVKYLKPNGLMVLSYPGRESAPTVNGVVVVDNRSYGDAALAFYRIVQESLHSAKSEFSDFVGIYTGAFDPVHDGHLAFAETALRQATLSRVVFVPEAEPRAKTCVSSLDQRVKQLQALCAGKTGLEVTTLTLPRFRLETALPELEAQFPGAQFVFLLGSDVVLGSLPHWDNLAELQRFQLIVGMRKGDSLRSVQNTLEQFGIAHQVVRTSYDHISSKQLRDGNKLTL